MAEHDMGLRPDERNRLKDMGKRGYTDGPLLHRALNVRCVKSEEVGYCHDCNRRISELQSEYCARIGHIFTLDSEVK